MKEFIITWSIENISYSWHRSGHKLISPEFFSRSMRNTTWTLELYPRGTDDSDYLSLKLRRVRAQGPDNLAVSFEFSCISEHTPAIRSSVIPGTSQTFENDGYDAFLEPCFLQRCEVFGPRKALYLPKDILTLRCRIWNDGDDSDELEQIFGRTQLTVEQIVTVENFTAEKSLETFQIRSKTQNRALMSITVRYFDDKLHVRINSSREENMKFSTCSFIFVNDLTGRKLCEHIRSYFGVPKKEEWRMPFSDKEPPTEYDNSGGRHYSFIVTLKFSTGEENKIIEKNCPVKISELLSNYMNNFDYVGDYISSSYPNISSDLRRLSAKELLCDVKLKTQNETFDAHKAVLCARSPVFTAMLTSGMEENRTACIEIEDISSDTLKILLNFLYTDSFEELEWDAIVELYCAADKYGVELLKLLCCSHLCKKVAMENVFELLMLADRRYDRKLERKILDLISKNDEQVFKSSEWKKFSSEHENHEMAMKAISWKYEERENTGTYVDWISSHPKMKDDFRTLYQNQIVCDVLIKAAGATFPAHRTVLCASSTTFIEEFTNNSTDVFEMEDWEYDTVSRMLLFLYTDSLEDIQWDIAMKLYQLAVVYGIRRLQIRCSCFLLENLSVSNAGNLLLLADGHMDYRLEPIVKRYIFLHHEEIFGSDEWADFSESHSRLANETMRMKFRKKDEFLKD